MNNDHDTKKHKNEEDAEVVEKQRRIKTDSPRTIAGFVFILLGGMFLLDNFNIFTFEELSRYWPVALIVIGILVVFKDNRK